MVQPGLIESILTELHLLDDSEPKDTPSLGIFLHGSTARFMELLYYYYKT
jgi:hypothetical protein